MLTARTSARLVGGPSGHARSAESVRISLMDGEYYVYDPVTREPCTYLVSYGARAKR